MNLEIIKNCIILKRKMKNIALLSIEILIYSIKMKYLDMQSNAYMKYIKKLK